MGEVFLVTLGDLLRLGGELFRKITWDNAHVLRKIPA